MDSQTFFKRFSLVEFKKGKIIYNPDENISYIYCLKEGLVRMYTISDTGDEINLNLFREGSYFPIMLILADVKNIYYFEAQKNVTCYKAPASEVLKFLTDNPEEAFELTKKLSQAICGLILRIEDLASHSTRQKIVNLLLYFSNKFGRESDLGTEISIRFNHEDLAKWCGTTRETVSRVFSKLLKEKVVKIENKKIIICDLQALKKFS